MDLTASFLTGSVLTLVIPLAVLALVLLWWASVMRGKNSGGDA
jgi:hypothetical protein